MMLEAVSEYKNLFKDARNAEKLTQIFWSFSAFPEDMLFEKLKCISETDFEDDYSAFLKKDNLLKAGVSIMGCDSYRSIEHILDEYEAVPERIAKVATLFSVSAVNEYLANIERRFGEDYPSSLFPYMKAAVAILIVRSKNFLNDWSKGFVRIVDKHPNSAQSIKNVLSLVFRGEALVVDNYSTTHRSFNSCADMFVALVGDDNEEAYNDIYMKKFNRILDALGGK